jgi:hypothetical protein
MKTLKKYLITLGVGLLIAFAIANSRDVFAQTELSKIFHILTDSFFVPAVLIMGFGGLVFVSNEGAFDGLTYAVTSFVDIFRKEKKNQYHTYYDYKQSKGNRDHSFGFLLICGLVFMAITGIMYWLYTKNI